jgi:hypothetical protein
MMIRQITAKQYGHENPCWLSGAATLRPSREDSQPGTGAAAM